ncbi:MAG: WD40 repeat domain-containing protein, partial [Planctomycetes bacterium]|nr:WD40 repeat domain-containing protein [Planctomycetota bacterium]
KRLAVAGGAPAEEGIVEVYSWPEGKRLAEFQGHDDSVSGVAWIDNDSLAAASLDHHVSVWDLDQEKPRLKLKGHSRGVTTVAVVRHNEKSMLVSAGLDQNLRVWDLQTGRQLRSLKNHTREVHQLAVRPSAEGLPMVASVSQDHTVRLWQPTIGRMVRFARLTSPPLAVAWLSDGSLVAVASADGAVRLVDPDTAKVVRELPALDGWAYSLAAHPKDGSLAVGGRNGVLKRIVIKEIE